MSEPTAGAGPEPTPESPDYRNDETVFRDPCYPDAPHSLPWQSCSFRFLLPDWDCVGRADRVKLLDAMEADFPYGWHVDGYVVAGDQHHLVVAVQVVPHRLDGEVVSAVIHRVLESYQEERGGDS